MNDPDIDGLDFDLDGDDAVRIFVDPSKLRAILASAASLVAFGSAFAIAIVKLLAARDFVGLWLFLQREDTLSGMAMAAGAAVFAYRLYRAGKRKGVEVELAKTSPIAKLTTEVDPAVGNHP